MRILGERESGTARLEEAVKAYRDALPVFRTGAPHHAQWASRNLALAENLIRQRGAFDLMNDRNSPRKQPWRRSFGLLAERGSILWRKPAPRRHSGLRRARRNQGFSLLFFAAHVVIEGFLFFSVVSVIPVVSAFLNQTPAIFRTIS